MEKYDAILRAINDKIAGQESTIEWYREEMSKNDVTIRELKAKVSDLELSLCDETQKNNELTAENEQLKETLETYEDEIIELRKAIESLKAENDKLSTF